MTMNKSTWLRRLAALARCQRGMSVIELLVAALIGILVVMAAMDAYLTLHTSTIMQDEITEMQQSGRAAMRILSEHLRMAGFSLPATVPAIEGSDSNPDTLVVRFMDANGCEATSTANMGGQTDPIECTGWDLSCFQVGRPAYIFDAVAGVGEFFQVTGVSSSPEAVTHGGLSQTYPSGSRVSFIRELTYFVDNSDTLHPGFMQEEFAEGANLYAENMEDFQLRYVMMDDDTTDTPANPTLIRSVLVNLVSRTNRVDGEMEQDYHRRNFAFQVSVRNNE